MGSAHQSVSRQATRSCRPASPQRSGTNSTFGVRTCASWSAVGPQARSRRLSIPLTGAFYAFELIIGTYSAKALAPAVCAAITATFVGRILAGNTFLIEVGEIGLIAPRDFLLAILLGAVCAGVGIVIMKGVAFTEQIARKSSIHASLRPAIGGIVVGFWP